MIFNFPILQLQHEMASQQKILTRWITTLMNLLLASVNLTFSVFATYITHGNELSVANCESFEPFHANKKIL